MAAVTHDEQQNRITAGILTLVVGFIIMSLESNQHGFGFLGLTLGPIVVMAGFVIEIFAILHKPTR